MPKLGETDDNPLSEWSAAIEVALAEACESVAGCPERLEAAIRYSLMAPGKRLRPVLVLLASEACGGDPAVAMPAAVAVEMIHAYSLIHDDLPAMDDDALRRGRATCHIQFDEATAILAGDALQARAFELVAQLPDAVAPQACRILATAVGCAGLVGGQMDDLRAERKMAPQSVDFLDSIHRRKTAALLGASLHLGAVSAGGTEDQRHALASFGEALGLAFQIVDDLLDVEATASELGKEAGKDAARGKLTYPGVVGIESSRQKARDLICKAKQTIEDPQIQLRPAAVRRLHWISDFIVERKH